MSTVVNTTFENEETTSPVVHVDLIKEYLNFDGELTKEEHAAIGDKLHTSAYTKAVYTGREIPTGIYSPRYEVNTTHVEREAPAKHKHVEYTQEEIDEFFVQVSNGETNDLFKDAFANIEKIAPLYDYSVKDFFRMSIKFGMFSFFGRQDFDFKMFDGKEHIKIVMSYIDPSLDEPDIEKLIIKASEPPRIFKNKKYVTIIFNKTTGIVAKCELTNRYSNCMWVWNCRTGDLIFTHYGRIAYNNTVKVYFECVSTNVFFSNQNCHPVMREDIVSSVDVKTVKVTKYKIPEIEDVVVGAEVFRTITFQSIIDKRISERNEIKARREKEAEARIAAATKKAAKKTANAVEKAVKKEKVDAETDAKVVAEAMTDAKAAAKVAKKEKAAAKSVVRAVKKEKKSD